MKIVLGPLPAIEIYAERESSARAVVITARVTGSEYSRFVRVDDSTNLGVPSYSVLVGDLVRDLIDELHDRGAL